MNIKKITILLLLSIFISPIMQPVLAQTKQTKEEKSIEKVKNQIKNLEQAKLPRSR